MTIYFAGGEDTSFTSIGTGIGTSTNTNYVRPTYARYAFTVNNTGVADPPASRLVSPAFTAASSLWVHAQVGIISIGASTVNQQGLIIRSPDGVARLLLRQTATTGGLKISSRNAAGTITDLAASTINLPANGMISLDLQINYVAAGSVNLYLGGALAATFSGDPRTDAATQLDQIDLATVCNGLNGNAWSEVVVADTDTRSVCLWTLAPAAAGNTQSWTPNTVGNINKTAINDASFISTSSNNALSEWTTGAAPSAPAGTYNVLAVVQEARVETSVSGPQHFDWLVRTGNTDNLAGNRKAPPLSFATFGNQIWQTNPQTGVAWTMADLTATGFNLGIESQA